MPVEIEPPELARLVDFAERPRVDDWSLRSALVRYAQPQPARVSAVLDVVRRCESALKQHAKSIERGDLEPVAGLLGVLADLDALGDVLATWAVDRAGAPPDEKVDAVTKDATRRLDELGVARDEGQRPPVGRRRGV